MAWVKVLYLVNIVTPKFWAAKRRQDYLNSTFSDGLPLPGDSQAPQGEPEPSMRPEDMEDVPNVNRRTLRWLPVSLTKGMNG
eukprot:6990414-Pyramimonas_sp.AAC.1